MNDRLLSPINKLQRSDSLRKLSSIIRQNSFLEPVILNPFTNVLRLPWYEWVKIGVMSVTVAPVRLVFIIAIFGVSSILASIGCMCSNESTFIGTLVWWRKSIRYTCRKLFRLIFFFCGFHYVKIRGRRANPHEAMVLVGAPHSSFCDTLIAIFGRTLSGISKVENSEIPGLGSFSKLLQPIWVNREDVNSRKRTIELLAERTKYAGHMPQILVFPEGTTTNRSCLINFKAGAFIPGTPIQPVLIKYPNRVDCISWTAEQLPVLLMAWIMLCQFHNRCTIEYLEVYVPNEKEKIDAKLFANNVRSRMAYALDIPTTDHSYEDVRLMTLAKKHQLPQAAGIVEFSKLSRKLTLNFTNMSDFIKYFAEISRELKGKITIEAFAEYLGLPISPEVQKLFNMYDRNRTGYIDFREYVIGMCLVTMPANTEESLRLAFEMLDPFKTGEINEYEFLSVMNKTFNMEHNASLKLFQEMDISKTGSVSYEDFIAFARNKPEFIKIVSLYNDFQLDAQIVDKNDPIRPRKEKLL